MTPHWVTVAVVACAIMRGDTHVHDLAIAQREAEGFLAAATPVVPLELLMAVGYVESRFGPEGSERDQRNGVFGVMQLQRLDLRCSTHCTDAQLAARAEYFDPFVNIRRGAALLALRRSQVLAGRYGRNNARVRGAWPGAYYRGSVPASRRRRVVREFYRYAGRVHAAQGIMRGRFEACRTTSASP